MKMKRLRLVINLIPFFHICKENYGCLCTLITLLPLLYVSIECRDFAHYRAFFFFFFRALKLTNLLLAIPIYSIPINSG